MNQTEITFMGHKITNKGIKADPEKIRAITAMKAPSDVTGVKRFCGMIQYLARYLPSLSSDLEPLRCLTKKGVDFVWSEQCDTAFKCMKDKITRTPVLAFYDPNVPLTVQTDSSKDGLGVVLMQNGRPVEYASKALTAAQRNWCQLEKELLSVVFGLEKFHTYTYARKVTVFNDHKPLEMILRKPLSKAPRRVQALIMRLLKYDIDYKYIAGTSLYLADTLSRAYDTSADSEVIENVNNVYHLQDYQDIQLGDLKSALNNDDEAVELKKVIMSGWPEDKSSLHFSVRPYFHVRDELSVDNDFIIKGQQLFIPVKLRSEVLNNLHRSHMGYDSMIRRARENMFWVGMPKAIKQIADNCDVCQRTKPQQQKETLIQHDEGYKPFEKVGIDLFEFANKKYLITVDYFTNVFEIDLLPVVSASSLIICLKRHFARYGIPLMLVTDFGPQFANHVNPILTSSQFIKFKTEWKIQVEHADPGCQWQNGKSESAVKIAKKLLQRTSNTGEDQFLALLELRNTPRQDCPSPCTMLFGKQTRSLLPFYESRKNNHFVSNSDRKKRQKRKQVVKRYYDKTARDLPSLTIGENVYFQHPNKPGWVKGVIKSKLSSRSYIIESESGVLYRRNRIHIKPDPSDSDNFDFCNHSSPLNSQQNLEEDTVQFSPVASDRPNRNVRPPERYGHNIYES